MQAAMTSSNEHNTFLAKISRSKKFEIQNKA